VNKIISGGCPRPPRLTLFPYQGFYLLNNYDKETFGLHLQYTTIITHSAFMSHTRTIELDLLERKIRRLVAKLKKNNIQLEVFSHDAIEYGSTLGKGGEGVVQKCTVLYNNLPISAAVKTITNNTDDALNLTLDEIELLCLARDPIVSTTLQVYGVAAIPEKRDPTKGHLVIITEVGLKNVLQLYQDESIPLHLTFDIWSRLAAALHCMHCKKIMHQDLKPENVLVTTLCRDTSGQIEKVDVRIIDLGMAQLVLTDKVYTDDILGTNGYHAPEVLLDDYYDLRADIFVLGITFCVTLMERSYLKKSTLQSTLKQIHEAKMNGLVGQKLFESVIEPAIPASILPSAVKAVICKMLESVDRRDITLLDIALFCTRESSKLCRQAYRTGLSQSLSNLQRDSGIDSTSMDLPSYHFAINEEIDEEHSGSITHSRHGRRKVRTFNTVRSPIYLRRRQREPASSTSSATLTREPLSDTSSTADPEPVCRRTRSAKRRSTDNSANESDEENETISRRVLSEL